MNGRVLLLGALLLGVVRCDVSAQFAGFASASYGFHNNPLYNYEKLSDQLRQAYVDLSYGQDFNASALKFDYIGGLMIFNRFTDRNYYEHNLQGLYSVSFRPEKDIHDTTHTEEGEEEETAWTPAPDDSCGSFLDACFKFGGRHDKEMYRDFDNVGLAATGSYRLAIGESYFLRASNVVTFRRYVFIDALTNVTDDASFQFGTELTKKMRLGIQLGGGLKHYTASRIDTSRVETQRTYTLKSTGKGKGGAKIKVPSSKLLLVNSGTNDIVQLSGELFFIRSEEELSVDARVRYQYNPGAATRYIAQVSGTSMLTEDVYTDKFSYEGPLAQVRLTRMLPFRVNAILTAEGTRKRFGAPALNLLGEQNADNRIDLRTRLELYLSRYIQISDGFAMDIALAGEAMRNESNDDYNDFSLYQVSASLGFGF